MKPPRWFWAGTWTALGLVVLTSLPYLYAFSQRGEGAAFGGFLFNPQDGYSYLAKMRQGWDGAWRFQLPYTAETGRGAYLFLFYLGLGHLARLLNLSLPLAYHLARALGAAALGYSLARFFTRLLPPAAVRPALLLGAFGSGMGWLALPFGAIPSDFWVAEAFPFLSAYATPHFGLGLALMGYLLTPPGALSWRSLLGTAAAALALAVISPFGVVIVGVVWAGLLAWTLIEARGRWQAAYPALAHLLAVGLAGGPLMLYDLWAAASDPLLAGWNAQNLTRTPPVWDVLLACSPALLLALPAAVRLLRQPEPLDAREKVLLAWAVLGLVLPFLPLGLQRRFLMGVLIPLAGLAGLQVSQARLRPALAALVLALALPTNLLLLAGSFGAAAGQQPNVYLSRGEQAALAWLDQQAPDGARVLAAPDFGLFIPPFSGQRVLYGHPYETVNAAAEKAAVEAFYRGQAGPDFLAARRVDYVVYGPREAGLGRPPALDGLRRVWEADGVQIYAAGGG